MKEIVADKELIAFCGINCAACGKYRKGKCPGCKENEKAKWCKIRTCCFDNKYQTCADCQMFENVNQCKKFNNFVSKLFEFFFRSDRKAGIRMIREKGLDDYTKYMSDNKLIVIKK